MMTSQYKILYPANFPRTLGTDIQVLANKMLEDLVVNVQTVVAAGTIRGRDDRPISVTEGALSRIPIKHSEIKSSDTDAISEFHVTVPDTMDEGVAKAYRLVMYSAGANVPEISIEEFVQAHIANGLTTLVKQKFRSELSQGKPKRVKAAKKAAAKSRR